MGGVEGSQSSFTSGSDAPWGDEPGAEPGGAAVPRPAADVAPPPTGGGGNGVSVRGVVPRGAAGVGEVPQPAPADAMRGYAAYNNTVARDRAKAGDAPPAVPPSHARGAQAGGHATGGGGGQRGGSAGGGGKAGERGGGLHVNVPNPTGARGGGGAQTTGRGGGGNVRHGGNTPEWVKQEDTSWVDALLDFPSSPIPRSPNPRG
ncbi:hypothetical protein T484DRAFT_1908311 [Baffinella frigidus]|nr:hypothetical protein T484DRAFT_1908311 [Cryptophyta sp. CCMP2293]